MNWEEFYEYKNNDLTHIVNLAGASASRKVFNRASQIKKISHRKKNGGV